MPPRSLRDTLGQAALREELGREPTIEEKIAASARNREDAAGQA